MDRLKFEKVTEVPHQGQLGFVILQHGATELTLQSRASLRQDVPAIAEGPQHAVLYYDLAPIRTALEGWPPVTPERTTFYGTREIVVRDPAGNVVFFAEHQAG